MLTNENLEGIETMPSESTKRQSHNRTYKEKLQEEIEKKLVNCRN